VTEAIYSNGVLEPKGRLALREDQHVRSIVQAFDEGHDAGDRPAALRRLLAGMGGMRFLSRERLRSRVELHDRA